MQSSEIKKIISKHIGVYPKMQAEDAVKLLYQSEFAGGHLIDDEDESLRRLKAEYEALDTVQRADDDNPFEDIGGGLCRINLRAIKRLGLKIETVNRFFIDTANTIKGSVKEYEQKLGVLLQLCRNGELPFESEKVRIYIDSLKEEGFSPLSHSEEYRQAYDPAYRVIKDSYREYIKAFQSIDSLLKAKDVIIVAIDGNCAAGKSALASVLGGVYDCNIFHMDDFFLRPEQRTPQRLGEPGGNVDRERFYNEVITGLKSGRPFTYRKYDCRTQNLGEPVSVTPKALNIIEGSYSLHPVLIGFYDLKIFLQISAGVQSERILKRSGAKMHERFISEWVPMENRYFESFDIRSKCDLVFGNND